MFDGECREIILSETKLRYARQVHLDANMRRRRRRRRKEGREVKEKGCFGGTKKPTQRRRNERKRKGNNFVN